MIIIRPEHSRAAGQDSWQVAIYKPGGRWLRLAALFDREQPFPRRGLWWTRFSDVRGPCLRLGPQNGPTLMLLAHYQRHNGMVR